jgi:hypothetical protein
MSVAAAQLAVDHQIEHGEVRTGENGGFLPPGRMRSRRRFGSSTANETIMTAAKIAR